MRRSFSFDLHKKVPATKIPTKFSLQKTYYPGKVYSHTNITSGIWLLPSTTQTMMSL